MSVYKTKEAEELLLKELKDVGFFETIDCKKAWNAFKKFADYEFDCGDDAFLWETITMSFNGECLFYYSMVRQFERCVDDGFVMEQLHLTINFKPDQVLDNLQDVVWSYDFDSKEDFFKEIESRKSFTLPPASFIPIKYDVYFEQV